uniref:Uncharacterized protein n=1 Tax=Oryza glumipatula TaxID=40148 RepID=A0A0E0BQE1_9ORYZ
MTDTDYNYINITGSSLFIMGKECYGERIQQPQIEYETLHNPFQKGKQFIHIAASPASTEAFPSNQQFSTPPWLLLLQWCLQGNRWQLLSSRRLSPGP